MKLQIKATNKLTTFDGVPVRLWEGTTENGIPCKVFVHRIAVANDADHTEFETALAEQLPPGGTVVPLSAIL